MKRIIPENHQKEIYRLLSSLIVPRPIAWISTVSNKGIYNLAPYSFYNLLTTKPPIVGFTVGYKDGKMKDTSQNISASGDFVLNLVTRELLEKMNISAVDAPADISEFELAKLNALPGEVVRSPRVKEAPVQLECKLLSITDLGEGPSSFIMGEIVCMHLQDGIYENGVINNKDLEILGRLSGNEYCLINNRISLNRKKYGEI